MSSRLGRLGHAVEWISRLRRRRRRRSWYSRRCRRFGSRRSCRGRAFGRGLRHHPEVRIAALCLPRRAGDNLRRGDGRGRGNCRWCGRSCWLRLLLRLLVDDLAAAQSWGRCLRCRNLLRSLVIGRRTFHLQRFELFAKLLLAFAGSLDFGTLPSKLRFLLPSLSKRCLLPALLFLFLELPKTNLLLESFKASISLFPFSRKLILLSFETCPAETLVMINPGRNGIEVRMILTQAHGPPVPAPHAHAQDALPLPSCLPLLRPS